MSCVDKNQEKVKEKKPWQPCIIKFQMKTEIFERIIYISTADKKESTYISMSYKLTFILEHKKNLDWNYYFFRLWFKYYAHWNLLSHFYSNINMTLISIVHRKKSTTSTTLWIFCIKMKGMNSTYPFYPELIPVILPYTVHKVEVKSFWNWHRVPLVSIHFNKKIINPIFYRKKNAITINDAFKSAINGTLMLPCISMENNDWKWYCSWLA